MTRYPLLRLLRDSAHFLATHPVAFLWQILFSALSVFILVGGSEFVGRIATALIGPEPYKNFVSSIVISVVVMSVRLLCMTFIGVIASYYQLTVLRGVSISVTEALKKGFGRALPMLHFFFWYLLVLGIGGVFVFVVGAGEQILPREEVATLAVLVLAAWYYMGLFFSNQLIADGHSSYMRVLGTSIRDVSALPQSTTTGLLSIAIVSSIILLVGCLLLVPGWPKRDFWWLPFAMSVGPTLVSVIYATAVNKLYLFIRSGVGTKS